MPTPSVTLINAVERTDPYALSVKCQCSPNNTILPPQFEEEAGRWVCPGEPYSPECDGNETYVAVQEPELLARIASAFHQLAARYGPPQDEKPTLFLKGDYPETTHMRGFGEHWLVNLDRTSNLNQYSGQIGHECFHRWCTPPGTFSWVHEMLAEAFKLRYLIRVGMGVHATKYELSEARANPSAMTVTQLKDAEPPFLRNTDFYNGALIVGHDLHEAVGEQPMIALAKSFDPNGRPDIDAWLDKLPTETENVAAKVLGVDLVDLTPAVDITPKIDLVEEQRSEADSGSAPRTS